MQGKPKCFLLTNSVDVNISTPRSGKQNRIWYWKSAGQPQLAKLTDFDLRLHGFSINDGSRASLILAILPGEYKSFMKNLLMQNGNFNNMIKMSHMTDDIPTVPLRFGSYNER
uniref:Uncharacterized protein n=1 Tax=Glossina austeni TaxID=7395 RepID=A0A1A9VYX5_GLOAU